MIPEGASAATAPKESPARVISSHMSLLRAAARPCQAASGSPERAAGLGQCSGMAPAIYSAFCGGKSPYCRSKMTRPRGRSTKKRHEWCCLRCGEPEDRNDFHGHHSVKVTTCGPVAPTLIVVRQCPGIRRRETESPGPGSVQSLPPPGVRGKILTIGHDSCTRAMGSAADAMAVLPEVVRPEVVGVLARWLPAQPDAANTTVTKADNSAKHFTSGAVRHRRLRCHTLAWVKVLTPDVAY